MLDLDNLPLYGTNTVIQTYQLVNKIINQMLIAIEL